MPVPPGFRLSPAPGLHRLNDGRLLLGGAPATLMRLSPAAADLVSRWLTGTPLPSGRRAGLLARRLLAAGMADPVPPADAVTPVDAPGTSAARGAAGVTVVIPVRDRPGPLARCLAALAACTPPPTAVLVVDDGSSDPAAVARAAAAGGARLLRHPANRGPAAARNTGLAAAGTDLVAFLDSDCVPDSGWLDRLLPHFADPAVAAVAPRITAHTAAGPHRPATPAATALAAYEGAHSALDMGVRPAVVRPGSVVPYVPSAALVVRRAAVGTGFDEALRVGEDVDLVWRMAAAGWHVRYEPAARVGHAHRVRPAAWFARRLVYGTSAAPLARRHPETLPAVAMSGWSLAAWVAAAGGFPLAGVGITAGAGTVLARRLRGWAPQPWLLAGRLAGGGTWAAGELLGRAVLRAWLPVALPVAVVSRRARLPLAAAVVGPPVLAWWRDHGARAAPGGAADDPLRGARGLLRFVPVRIADDVAYGLGVWVGCARHRTAAPLLPRLSWRGRTRHDAVRTPPAATAGEPSAARTSPAAAR